MISAACRMSIILLRSNTDSFCLIQIQIGFEFTTLHRFYTKCFTGQHVLNSGDVKIVSLTTPVAYILW